MASNVCNLKPIKSVINIRKGYIVIIAIFCFCAFLVYVTYSPVILQRHHKDAGNLCSRGIDTACSFVFTESSELPYYPKPVTLTRNEFNVNQFDYDQSISEMPRPSVTPKLILFYNRPEWLADGCEARFDQCPVKSCVSSCERSKLPEADAVLVDIIDLSEVQPPHRYPDQVWIAFGMESPYHYHTSAHASKQWRHDVFNWTMTYRLDSEVAFPYDILMRLKDVPNRNFTEISLRKSKSAAWMVSNCQTPSKRYRYVNMLQQYYSVDIYGHCGPLKCSRGEQRKCKDLLENTYKFYLAFENSLCKDYVTEKLFMTFSIDIVPVVRGGADYASLLPVGTYVNTADFSSPRKLAEYLQYLERNVTAYSEILRRKSQYISARMASSTFVSAYCDICMKLHNVDNHTHSYHDNVNWFSEGACRSPNDLS